MAKTRYAKLVAYPTGEATRKRACPQCLAKEGNPCVKKDGTPKSGHHQQRVNQTAKELHLILPQWLQKSTIQHTIRKLRKEGRLFVDDETRYDYEPPSRPTRTVKAPKRPRVKSQPVRRYYICPICDADHPRSECDAR